MNLTINIISYYNTAPRLRQAERHRTSFLLCGGGEGGGARA